VVAGLATFFFQNGQDSPVNFLWMNGSWPQWTVIGISVAIGIVLARIELRDEEQLLVGGHRRLKRCNRFLAADEQWHDAVREDDDVAQRKDGKRSVG